MRPTSRRSSRVRNGFFRSFRFFTRFLESSVSPDRPGTREQVSLFLEQLEDRTVPNAGTLLPSQAEPFVQNLYQVLLDRTGGPGEVAGWTTVMDSGQTPSAVAAGFLASPEYNSLVIKQAYEHLLGREPEPGVTGKWVAALQQGLTQEQLLETVLASDEYLAGHGGGTPAGWAAALYQDVLGRAPDPAGLAYWTGLLGQGDSRLAVAQGFVDSPEAHRDYVTATYQSLLGRTPTPAEQDSWAAALDQGLSRQQFAGLVVASPEFLQRVEGADLGAAPAATAVPTPPASLVFEPNEGQTDPAVKFLAHGRGYTFFLTPTALEVTLARPGDQSGTAVRLDLVGANPAAVPTGLDELPGQANYFWGNQALTDIATYGRVEVQNVYPGIDLEVYGNAQGEVEFDFCVQPGADPGQIRLAYEGAAGQALDGAGNLVLHTAQGDLVQESPALYQEDATGRQAVAGQVVPQGGGQLGFQAGTYDRGRPLVIDPALSFSSYLGGSNGEAANGLARDSSGNLYLTGLTNSTNFPTTPGAYQTNGGMGESVFITKVTAAGALAYSTYLGNYGQLWGQAIAVDAAGEAFVTGGFDEGANFPTSPGAFQTGSGNYVQSAFVTKLNAAGDQLDYSTELWGGNDLNDASNVGNAIALDGSGHAFVTGITNATSFPITSGAYQTTGGTQSAFVTEFTADGKDVVYSTYLTVNGYDGGYGIALDGSGRAYVAGSTATQQSAPPDAFLAVLSADGSALASGAVLGGSGSDVAYAVAVDASGNAYLAGQTASANFPTTAGAYQRTLNGSANAFVSEVSTSSAQGQLLASTYLGGSDSEQARAVGLLPDGDVAVAGQTTSPNFPTVNGVQPLLDGTGQDAFISRLNLTQGALVSSTYLGGAGTDVANALAVAPDGTVWVDGQTGSDDFPVTAAAFQAASGGSTDAFLAHLALPPMPPPTPPRQCSCGGPDLVGMAAGGDGGDPAGSGFSQSGLRYFDGTVSLVSPALDSEGFGQAWGQSLAWTNDPGLSVPGSDGSGWFLAEQPHLLAVHQAAPPPDLDTVAVALNPTDVRYFDYVSGTGTYQERYYLTDELTHSGDEYVLTDATGAQLTFYDFSTTVPFFKGGQFVSYTDPDGNVTQVTSWTSSGQPQEAQRSTTVDGTTTTESYLYTYLTSGPNTGLLGNVTLRRQVNGGGWTVIRQAAYTYYDGTQPYGNLGDLELAQVEDASGTVLDTSYYRYYTGEAGGYVGGLKYAFGPDSYARLLAAYPDPQAATDAQVAPYADAYFTYDSAQRVTQAVVQGQGCSSCAGGLGTYGYSYTASGNAPGFNSWATRTVETLPDGNQNIVYANFAGEVMLHVYHDATTNQNWETFYEYDGQGRLILTANPSAVTGYDDTKADLLNNQNGNYQYLSDTQGLISVTDYYASTTATETTAGGAAGYVQDTKVRQGELGTPILQDSTQYFAHTAGAITVYPEATTTAYRNTDGTGAETTSYSYTWFTGTAQMQSETVTLPVIAAAQNGPGTADVSTTYFDSYGRPVWQKDGDGFITYTEYDPATGAVTKAITDVDTTQTGEFQNLPAGWATPAGGGLNLVTQDQVDGLGRTTKETDPNGNVTYTVYNDSSYEVRVYPGWNSTTNMPTGPTQVTREDRPGSYTETLTMTAAPHLTNGVPDGTEPISDLQSLSRSYTNSAGQVVRQDDYFNLAGVTYSTAQYIGTQNTNYYTTLYAYDDMGRQDRVQSPTGTIDRTVYDGLGRVVSTWVGTDDTPGSGYWSPTNNTAPSNMVQVTADVYDNGGVGDGNLTQETDYPGGTAAPQVTQYFFDWRDRQVASKQGVQASENDGTHRPIVFNDYDNLDEVTATSQYDGDGVTITVSNGVPVKPSAGLLRAYQTSSYDDQGRVYASTVYSVDQSNGTISSTGLTTGTYYGHRGQVLAVSNPGGLWDKYAYDGAGRTTVHYSTDGASGISWGAAASIVGDNVLEQQETQYDANGNAILTIDRQRFDSETATGALGNPTTGPLARVYYAASYYDAADRLTASVDVGTNGGAPYTRPATVPADSNTVLVTSYGYTAAGLVGTTTDPRGIVTQTTYDALGRTTQTIADYTDGTPTNSSDQTTQYTYDGDGNQLTVTAVEPGGAVQTTRYVYGVTTATGSDINSNDILAAVQYPDPSTGQPSSSQQETYTVNALGQNTTFTDRNGTVHAYSYDVLGRQVSDAVTTLGAGVDGTVQRLDTAYDTGGRPYLFTSYASPTGGTVVNQVEDVYNGLGQLITEYQSQSGAVDTSTTPTVQYAYTEMAGGANNSRPVSMTYPNGRVLDYNYNAGLDSTISRLSSLSDSSGVLEAYTYLGLGTVVQRSHPQTGVNLTYIQQPGDPNANTDGGDKYTGLDRFGRVIDQYWVGSNPAQPTDRFQYGYDPNDNVLYRANLVNPSFSELYHANGASGGYDNFNEITGFARGVLSASQQGGTLDTIASPSRSQSWSFDGLGNPTSVTTDGTQQTETANQQNELTAVGSTGLLFDNNGNMTQDEQGRTLVYNAWNQLVAVKSGTNTLAVYGYDALGRRITEASGGSTRNLYYDGSQVIEERVGGQASVQYVWSPTGVNLLVERADNWR